MNALDCQVICQLLDIAGPTPCFVVGVVLRKVKERIFQIDTNMGFVRHDNILLCAQGAMARYMVWQNVCAHPEKPGILRQVRRGWGWAAGNRVMAGSVCVCVLQQSMFVGATAHTTQMPTSLRVPSFSLRSVAGSAAPAGPRTSRLRTQLAHTLPAQRCQGAGLPGVCQHADRRRAQAQGGR